MPWVAAVGSVAGGLISAYGAHQAAGTQQQAAGQAAQTQLQMLQMQQAFMQPWQTAGAGALQQLTTGTQPGGEFTKQFTLADAMASPTEQFVQQRSLDAMRNQMALGGQQLSTNAITGAGQLAGNIAGTFEQQAFNQWLQNRTSNLNALQSLAGLGMSATGAMAGQTGTAMTNLSNLQMGAGNAAAAGQVGMAGAIGGGVSNIGQMYALQQLLNPSTSGTPAMGGSAAYPTTVDPTTGMQLSTTLQ